MQLLLKQRGAKRAGMSKVKRETIEEEISLWAFGEKNYLCLLPKSKEPQREHSHHQRSCGGGGLVSPARRQGLQSCGSCHRTKCQCRSMVICIRPPLTTERSGHIMRRFPRRWVSACLLPNLITPGRERRMRTPMDLTCNTSTKMLISKLWTRICCP